MSDFFKAVELLGPVFRAVAVGLESGAPIVTALESGAVALAEVIRAKKIAETADADAAGLSKFDDLSIR